MKELTEFQESWLAALESGGYEQGKEFLLTNGRYCCLGVACAIFGMQPEPTEKDNERCVMKFDGKTGYAPAIIVRALNLLDGEGSSTDDSDTSLAGMNDGGMTFEQIAEKVRAEPELFFSSEDHSDYE